MRFRGAMAAFLLAMTFLIPAVPAASQTVTSDQILELFDRAALGGRDRINGQVYRWQGAATVRFTGAAAVRHLDWTRNQLADLSALTGLDLQVVDTIGADILVVFVDRFDDVLSGRYNALIDEFVAGPERREALLAGFRKAGAVCAGQIVATGSTLSGGIVLIPRDQLSPVVRSCISAQLSRVMGLPFAAPENAISVLASGSPYSHTTVLDKLVLRLLYHPRMKAGLGREDALTIARSVMPELLTSPN
jgi:hypothetical protein